MSWQSDIIDHLTDAAGIAAIVGTRIYADVADGSTGAPYLVSQVIATNGTTTHSGARGVEFPLIQLSCWATGKAAAIALADAVDAALDGQTVTGDSGLSFQFSNRIGSYDPDTKLYGEILEYRAATATN